ncbi:MAG: thioredoxin family protein, partial [Planctomycetota bacterium]|nr:thioredoxin family protein [Planctomycetota bacterium]
KMATYHNPLWEEGAIFMRNRFFAAGLIVLGLVFLFENLAGAELCDRCRETTFSMSVGKCSGCGGQTQSSAWKFCSQCADTKHVCPACGSALPETPQTPPVTPPVNPPVTPDDPRKPKEPPKPLEVVWVESYAEAQKQAKTQPRPIFLFFYQKASQSSQVAENKVVKDKQVVPLAVQFICVKVDPKKEAELAKLLEQRTAPAYILCDAEGKKLAHLKEKTKADQLATEMKKVLDTFKPKDPEIEWITDPDQGIQKAQTAQKCLLMYFFSPGDAACVAIEDGLFKDADMIRASRHLICVKTDWSKPVSKTTAERFERRVQTLPTMFLSNSQATEFDVVTCNDSATLRRKISEFLARYGMNAAFDAEEIEIERERVLRAMKDRKVTLNANGMPLEEAVASFRAQNVELYFADDFPADKYKMPVTVKISGVPAEDAVRMLCEAAGLSYDIQGEKILLRG